MDNLKSVRIGAPYGLNNKKSPRSTDQGLVDGCFAVTETNLLFGQAGGAVDDDGAVRRLIS
jgi:hypothetical protein